MIKIERLADRPDALPVIKSWLVAEWPAYYGPGMPGPMQGFPERFARMGRLPLGVVALADGAPAGVAVLKTESIASHAHLSPWVTNLFVAPPYRRRGVAAELVGALEEIAREFGFPRLFCATNTADSSLTRRGWTLKERTRCLDTDLAVYEKNL